jgi:transposase InsO family protein
MCTEAWENAYSERINKTIKTEYLDGWKIKNYKSLVKRTKMAVDHYNNQREHSSLNKLTPAAFERQLKTIPEQERTVLKIYKKQSSL